MDSNDLGDWLAFGMAVICIVAYVVGAWIA